MISKDEQYEGLDYDKRVVEPLLPMRCECGHAKESHWPNNGSCVAPSCPCGGYIDGCWTLASC